MTVPKTPAYNASVGQADKAMHVAQNPPISLEMAGWIDLHFRDRWRAIVGVDDMIGLLVAELEKLQILDSTYIFVTSDHGYKLGEWRMGCSKEHPYESDVHIPLLVRGPGIAAGTRMTALAANIDIAPTFLEIVGLPPNEEHDGSSMLSLLRTTAGTEVRPLCSVFGPVRSRTAC
jgi:N-acetylglucosamine-6-sulfatase